MFGKVKRAIESKHPRMFREKFKPISRRVQVGRNPHEWIWNRDNMKNRFQRPDFAIDSPSLRSRSEITSLRPITRHLDLDTTNMIWKITLR
jgi:hypothetical protein